MAITAFNATNDKYGHNYKQFRRSHPYWYVINVKSNDEMMLHRVDCNHFEFGRSVNLAANAKLCAETKRELEAWARAKGIKLENCRTCL